MTKTAEIPNMLFAINTLFKNLGKRYKQVTRKVKGDWEFMRPRKDKTHPNGFITARNVFATLFEENVSKTDLCSLSK
jgi:hypothetical protein